MVIKFIKLQKLANLTHESAATSKTQRGELMGDLRLRSVALRHRTEWAVSVVDLKEYATSVFTSILQMEEEFCLSDLVTP